MPREIGVDAHLPQRFYQHLESGLFLFQSDAIGEAVFAALVSLVRRAVSGFGSVSQCWRWARRGACSRLVLIACCFVFLRLFDAGT